MKRGCFEIYNAGDIVWWVSLLVWVSQFGVSAILPLCAGLLLGVWLQEAFATGPWIAVLCGVFGLATSIRTVCICYRTMRKEADKLCEKEERVPAYNDHD